MKKKKSYRKKVQELEASFAKDDERADMRNFMNTEWMRARVVSYHNGGTSSRPR